MITANIFNVLKFEGKINPWVSENYRYYILNMYLHTHINTHAYAHMLSYTL